MAPFHIWIRAQVTALLLFLPAVVFPPLYFLLAGINLVFGLPAIVFFYLLLVLVKHFFTNKKPVTTWVAALACLPGMLLITGGCILIATAAICSCGGDRFEWELSAFGIPAMIGTILSVCIGHREIHRFIYPDLYADNFKKDTPQFPGMVDA